MIYEVEVYCKVLSYLTLGFHPFPGWVIIVIWVTVSSPKVWAAVKEVVKGLADLVCAIQEPAEAALQLL